MTTEVTTVKIETDDSGSGQVGADDAACDGGPNLRVCVQGRVVRVRLALGRARDALCGSCFVPVSQIGEAVGPSSSGPVSDAEADAEEVRARLGGAAASPPG